MLEYLHQYTGFQFLIGRLDTPFEGAKFLHLNRFQFLIGRLDTVLVRTCLKLSLVCFNSS